MPSKSQRHAETEIDAAEPAQEQLPVPRIAAARIAIAESGPSPVVYFDEAPFYAFNAGVASITLTARRQISDAAGRVMEDCIITGLLRAPLPVMLQLREVLDGIEKLAQQQAEAIVAAAFPSSGLPN